MINTILELLGFLGIGILGILLHNFIELSKINKRTGGKASLKEYWKLEKWGIGVSLLSIVTILCTLEYFEQIKYFAEWKGIAFIVVGYFGQSIITWAMGKAGKTIGMPDDLSNPKP